MATPTELEPAVLASPGGTLLRLFVQPRASKTGFVGMHGDRLKIRVAAPPVEGEANEEVIRFVAKAFGLAKSQVALVRGDSSRQKDVLCQGLAPAEALQRVASQIGVG